MEAASADGQLSLDPVSCRDNKRRRLNDHRQLQAFDCGKDGRSGRLAIHRSGPNSQPRGSWNRQSTTSRPHQVASSAKVPTPEIQSEGGGSDEPEVMSSKGTSVAAAQEILNPPDITTGSNNRSSLSNPATSEAVHHHKGSCPHRIKREPHNPFVSCPSLLRNVCQDVHLLLRFVLSHSLPAPTT